MTFPSNFLWGVATAGYQVEGDINNNDWAHFVNSPEIVSRVHGLGAFVGQQINLIDPGDALNHRDLTVFKSDLDRAVALGATVYRMSIEWSRLQPDPPTAPLQLDSVGVDFYAERIEAVLRRGLVLHLTLNHLTLPAWVLTPPVASTLPSAVPAVAIPDSDYLAHQGWESVETTRFFADYAAAVVGEYHSRFADRGQIFWATFNEPVGSMIGAGYFAGIWPPGFSVDGGRGRTAYFNLLRAHILAYDAIKEVSGGAAQVGIVHNMMHTQRTNATSAGSTAEAGAATGAIIGGLVGAAVGAAAGAAVCGFPCAILGAVIGAVVGAVVGAGGGAAAGAISGTAVDYHEEARQKFDYFYNEHLLNALALGSIDTEISAAVGGRRIKDVDTFIRDGDDNRPSHARLPRPPVPNTSRLDFLGINYYRTVVIYHDNIFALSVPYAGGIFKDDLRGTGEPLILVNDLGWGIHPSGLAEIVTRVHRGYQAPGGAALPIIISENGCPENADKLRAAYTVAHLEALERAMQEEDPERGRPLVLGYIHWTLADNYEWHHGYNDNARFGLFTVDREQINERRITEAAFAFHVLSRSGDPSIAREKFGSINQNWPEIITPSKSPGALWVGEVDGEPLRLWLTPMGSASIQGVLCYPRQNQWLRVDNVEYDSETRKITFSHDPGRGIPGRSFNAQVGDAGFESGVFTDLWPAPRRGDHSWFAERDPLVGVWIPTTRDLEGTRSWGGYEGWRMLSLERWEDNYWRSKLFWGRCTWESILDLRDVTAGGVTTLSWSATNGRFEAALMAAPTGNLLQGTFSPGSSGIENFLFEATRLPDGLPF